MISATAQRTTIEFDGKAVTLKVRAGLLGKRVETETIPIDKVVSVLWKPAHGISFGYMTIDTGLRALTPQTSAINRIRFDTQTQDSMAAVRDAIQSAINNR